MSNKGFAEIQTDIETPNDVHVAEKPLKTYKNRVKRVDINILKSKLQENESKEFKNEMGISISAWRWNTMQNEKIRIMLLVNDAIWMFCALVMPVFESWFLLSKQLDWHGQIISMKENKWEKINC